MAARNGHAEDFGRVAMRWLALALGVLLLVRDDLPLTPEVTAAAPLTTIDTDHDGLTDTFETYLADISTDPALAADVFDADSDGDGLPDCFEYTLSDRQAVVSPGVLPPIEPRITIGSHQVGDELLLSFFIIPGHPSLLDKFSFLVATDTENGPLLADLSQLLALSIQSVTVARYNYYSCAAFRTSIKLSLLESVDSIAFALVGEVAGVKCGDSATFTLDENGVVQRWEYEPYTDPENPSLDMVVGRAEPQMDSAGSEYVAQQVCGSVDVRDPTGTPGLLQSVAQSVGCNGGSWKCSNSVCTGSGKAGQPKLLLDHLELLK